MNERKLTALAVIRGHLNCLKCNNLINDPYCLSCKHTFCRKCIEVELRQIDPKCFKCFERCQPHEKSRNQYFQSILASWAVVEEAYTAYAADLAAGVVFPKRDTSDKAVGLVQDYLAKMKISKRNAAQIKNEANINGKVKKENAIGNRKKNCSKGKDKIHVDGRQVPNNENELVMGNGYGTLRETFGSDDDGTFSETTASTVTSNGKFQKHNDVPTSTVFRGNATSQLDFDEEDEYKTKTALAKNKKRKSKSMSSAQTSRPKEKVTKQAGRASSSHVSKSVKCSRNIPEVKNMKFVAVSGFLPSEFTVVKKAVKTLGGANIVTDMMNPNWDVKKTTHLVCKWDDSSSRKCKRTVKYMTAVAIGAHIVDISWIESSVKAGTWLDAGFFELSGTDAIGTEKALPIERPIDNTNQEPLNIFSSLTCMLEGMYSSARLSISPSDMKLLLTLLGATNVFPVAHHNTNPVPDVIIASNDVSVEGARQSNEYFKVSVVSVAWVFDSVSFRKKMPYKNYLVDNGYSSTCTRRGKSYAKK